MIGYNLKRRRENYDPGSSDTSVPSSFAQKNPSTNSHGHRLSLGRGLSSSPLGQH
eukprot:Awhi_evm1s6793